MTTAEYHAYLQSLESGQSSEPSEKIGELPASHFGRMSAAEYQPCSIPISSRAAACPERHPTKETLSRPLPTESEEQQAVMKWAAAASGRWPELRLLYHVPMRASGAWPLADDCARKAKERRTRSLPAVGTRPIPRIYIEMKRTQGSKTTPEQKEWLAALEAEGYQTALCRGADAAIEIITDYLALPKARNGGDGNDL